MSLVDDNATSLRVVLNSGASDCTAAAASAAAAEQVTLGWWVVPANPERCGEAVQPAADPSPPRESLLLPKQAYRRRRRVALVLLLLSHTHTHTQIKNSVSGFPISVFTQNKMSVGLGCPQKFNLEARVFHYTSNEIPPSAS